MSPLRGGEGSGDTKNGYQFRWMILEGDYDRVTWVSCIRVLCIYILSTCRVAMGSWWELGQVRLGLLTCEANECG